MTIDGTDINTFGLIVQHLDDYFTFPGRKKILPEQEFGFNDQIIKEAKATVRLFGQYASSAALETGVNGLKTLLESTVSHAFVFTSRGISFSGVIVQGFKTRIFRNDVNIVFEIARVI